jgi:hypothetical protein
VKQKSALALFVTRILADHPHHILALHNLAALTQSFYRGSHFHKNSIVDLTKNAEPNRPAVVIFGGT